MTKREKQVVSAFTGTLLCSFQELHEYIEEILGRPVLTHELACEKILEEIKEKSRAECMKFCEE